MSSERFLDSLESRRMFAADFSASVNFQPAIAPRAPGMMIDYGSTYDARRGGFTYGWTADRTAFTADRNLTPVQRNDTFIIMGSASWEIAVPNGKYSVYVVSGDLASIGDRMGIRAEGEVIVAGQTKPRKPFLEGALTVDVIDGKLTLSPAGSGNDKINYVAITSVGEPTPPEEPALTGTLTWKKGTPIPVARVEPESAVVNGKLYVFGGYSSTAWQPIKRVDVYNPMTNSWTQLADMPVATTHAAVAVVGTKIWFAGGYTARPGTTDRQDIGTTQVFIYDTATNTYSNGPSLPVRRASGGMALVQNKLYFFAGEQPDRANRREMWMLDLAQQSLGWKARASIPEGRTHFGTTVVKNIIYAIGGQLGIDANAVHLKSNWAYQPATDKWVRLADMPVERSHLSPNTLTVGGKIYTFGGEYQFNSDLASVLEYDPATNRFKTLTSLPAMRAAGAAGYIGGKFIFSGGKNNGFFRDTYIGTFS